MNREPVNAVSDWRDGETNSKGNMSNNKMKEKKFRREKMDFESLSSKGYESIDLFQWGKKPLIMLWQTISSFSMKNCAFGTIKPFSGPVRSAVAIFLITRKNTSIQIYLFPVTKNFFCCRFFLFFGMSLDVVSSSTTHNLTRRIFSEDN